LDEIQEPAGIMSLLTEQEHETAKLLLAAVESQWTWCHIEKVFKQPKKQLERLIALLKAEQQEGEMK
jgi:hypothetical protein